MGERDVPGLHVHCESCYSRRCRARVEVSVSCAIASCRLLCGASFHLCKEEEHLLLCPNVRVPCLNAEYGCTLHMTRSWQATHLRVCPASVVSCSMDWLRWPVDDTNSHSNITLQKNVQKEDEGQGKALDFAMAVVDQRDLYGRLKMKPLFPEQMEEEEEEEEAIEDQKQDTATGGIVTNVLTNNSTDEGESQENNPGKRSGINIDKYNLLEMMFNMERGGCAAAQENQHRGGAGDNNQPQVDTSKTGLAPWQDGVLERLGKELSPQELNMYLVHHGRMLLTFGQIEACTPRERDFVYGNLEPIPVQTLRSFKIPDSYHYRRRVHLYDTSAWAQSEARSVDTSDLGAKEEDWHCDEAEATLLGYTELEVMGHKISETKGTDGLYVDVGTQTHVFCTAPFKGNTTLADVMVERPLKLHLQLQAESVNSRHNRASSVFTFLCGHTFHRREFATHFRNVHSDIQMCLSGWFEQRCPLAYLGCTYVQRRFQPSTHKATVIYNQELGSFNLRPTIPDSLDQGRAAGGEDSLSSLPYEVLCHMASFLDSLSLSQLALVSRLMRDVCSSLLQERGMVTLRWEKKTYSHGGVWEFSHLFSRVDSWCFADVPPISAHLKVCPYYKTSLHSEPVPLPSMSEQEGGSQERQSLVTLFRGNSWQYTSPI
uniref:F-box protein 40 n=1 Tax=Myripristis murdjan TaxID=586833 RepID=A0A667ZCQ6_9TELE